MKLPIKKKKVLIQCWAPADDVQTLKDAEVKLPDLIRQSLEDAAVMVRAQVSIKGKKR